MTLFTQTYVYIYTRTCRHIYNNNKSFEGGTFIVLILFIEFVPQSKQFSLHVL